MAAIRGMQDQPQREQVSFVCNKDSDYSFATVEKLIKAASSEIGKPNPFDPGYKNAMQVTQGCSGQTNDKLLRQVLINSNQAFPAMLQALQSLNVVANQGVANKTQGRSSQQSAGSKRDRCKKFAHYLLDCPDNHQPNQSSRIREVASVALPAFPTLY